LSIAAILNAPDFKLDATQSFARLDISAFHPQDSGQSCGSSNWSRLGENDADLSRAAVNPLYMTVFRKELPMQLKNTLCVLVLALIIAPTLGGCMSKAKRHLYTAEDLFEKGDLKGAKVELEESVRLDPDLADAHKSLAVIAEKLGDQEEAGREYDAVSRLDPEDKSAMGKARYFRQMKQLENSTGKALDDVKAGHIEDGINTLKEVLTQTKQKSAHDAAVASLRKAAASIAQQGYALYQQKKYQDAINTYAMGLKAYILIQDATQAPKIDPGADWFMKSINAAARAGNTPDRPFKILSDVVAADPETNVANNELAQIYLARNPPDYGTAADLLERAGASENQVKSLRAKAKHKAAG
jgi:tetratricopeptide (TPR) repeat protein